MMAREDVFEAVPVLKRVIIPANLRQPAQRHLLIKESFSVIFPFKEGFMSNQSDIYRRGSVSDHCLINFLLMFT